MIVCYVCLDLPLIVVVCGSTLCLICVGCFACVWCFAWIMVWLLLLGGSNMLLRWFSLLLDAALLVCLIVLTLLWVRLVMWLLCGLAVFDLVWWWVGSFVGLVLLIAVVVVVIWLAIGLCFGFLYTDFGCTG